ncbi:MAG: hypothetical protein J6A89_04435 [Clostridia bacterium]|nr:hypothetical protein [Clostridia bacterium]
MKKNNSYVFLQRNESKVKEDKDGNYILDLTNNVCSVLREIFNAEDKDLTLEELENPTDETEEKFEKMLLGETTGNFQLAIGEITRNIDFKLSVVDSTEYLDIIIEDDSEEILIMFMKEIHKNIISNVKLCENYIIITSYDSISEYFCNKVYPKLNEFERKFRKLLYITYTAQFKKSYFEITTSQELQKKAKEKIKSKNTDYRIQQYLYSLDFYAFKQLLFEKSWNEYDEKQLTKYLKKYNDLTKLTDLEIRNKMLSIHPTNDWERLFSNKNLDEKFESIITEIGKLRNIVAHNKIISETEYDKLNILLDNSIITIDKAIKITETDDFKRINTEKVSETMEKFSENFRKFTDEITNKISNLFENINFKNT